ncbi:MAG TPA: stage V sporulation protein AA [Clostridia bacterium]|nr:stage V sporulation protein AA [Clostridia bacterium]
MENFIYLQLEDYFEAEVGQDVYLKDIAELSCDPEAGRRLAELVILEDNRVGTVNLGAIEVIERIRRIMPGVPVLSVGKPRIIIHIFEKKGINKDVVAGPIKAAITGLLLFIGSGLVIMYFHEDVNMRQVHGAIYTAVTGQIDPNSYWISIPYSIGLGVGIAFFFGILTNKRKPVKPDPLEIGISKYKKEIRSYLGTKKDRNQKNR